jgi:hypothetical protein
MILYIYIYIHIYIYIYILLNLIRKGPYAVCLYCLFLQVFFFRGYSSWDQNELAKKVIAGKATLDELEAHAKKSGEPAATSGKQEWYRMSFISVVC